MKIGPQVTKFFHLVHGGPVIMTHRCRTQPHSETIDLRQGHTACLRYNSVLPICGSGKKSFKIPVSLLSSGSPSKCNIRCC